MSGHFFTGAPVAVGSRLRMTDSMRNLGRNLSEATPPLASACPRFAALQVP